MGPNIVARNYAETLLALAQRHGGDAAIDQFAAAMTEVAALLEREPRVREFLETPRVETEEKQRALRAALAGRVPELFLRFVLVVVEKRRQALLREIAAEYHDLVDEVRNRVHAEIVLAREPDLELQREILQSLERRLGKTVVATWRVDPALLGGVLIRVGDQILDGSLRHRVAGLRRRLLAARIPRAAAAAEF